jgi:(p)ppGpp synthase/HD superfamily hydrolase
MMAVAAPCRITAVLHDVVEDGDFGLGDILALFGEETRSAVDALTRRGGESYEDFIARCKTNHIARHVKIADIRDNLRPGAPHLRDRYEAALMALTEEY